MFEVSKLPKETRKWFKMEAAFWPPAVSTAIDGGISKSDDLANIVFFMHHKERLTKGIGKPLSPAEPNFKKLADEWKGCRVMILPMLKGTPPPSPKPIDEPAGVHTMSKTITKSVGKKQANRPNDVKTIQQLLGQHISHGTLALQNVDALSENGVLDKRTKRAIDAFQLRMFIRPDGVITPNRATLAALNKSPVLPNFGAVASIAMSGITSGPPTTRGMASIPSDLWTLALQKLLSQMNNSLIAKPEIVTLVDLRLAKTKRRMWVVDLGTRTILFNSVVSHGKGSGNGLIPTSFGNIKGSNKSSIGSYATLYTRLSKAGSKGKNKTRTALVIEGLEKSNNAARTRGIIFHGAHYVSSTRAGNSHGCFATEQAVNDKVIDVIKSGSFVYAKA